MDLLYILIASTLVVLNAFFVATEFAIVRVRETRISELVSRGVKRAAATRVVLHNLNTFISACQLGITLTSLGLGWVGEPAFAKLFEPLFENFGQGKTLASHTAAMTSAFVLISFLHIVFGELIPKSIAIVHSEATALLVAWPIRLFNGVFYPFIWCLNGMANGSVRLLGIAPPSKASLAHSEEELRIILSVSQKSGVLTESHARLLENALDFADRTVRQIMVPRGDVVYLDVNRSYASNLGEARASGHTRYPLCDGDLDRVLGIVHIKDLFLTPPLLGENVDLRSIAREPLLFPESLQIEQVLARFQKQRVHLGIVIDEYGGTSGLVAIEDVLEELTGEIQDEFDEEAPKVQRFADGRFVVDASLPLNEIEEQLGIHEEIKEEIDTLGGLVLTRLGRIARVGDKVDLGGRTVEVTRVRGSRILRVTILPGGSGAAQAPARPSA